MYRGDFNEDFYDLVHVLSSEIQRLKYENEILKQERDEYEQKYSKFLDSQWNATSKVTATWVKALVSGDLKLK